MLNVSQLRAAVSLERQRRYWTIAQWRDQASAERRDDWPSFKAETQLDADRAVDALLAEVERLRKIEEAAQAYVHYKIRTGKPPTGFYEWERLREVLAGVRE